MHWTLLVESVGRSGHDNMRVDDALLHAVREGVGFLRLYRWNPPCLSFGRNEPARARYDFAAIRGLGLDTVRRPTGGRAVWHDAELTYAVAAPTSTFGSLRATYHAIHEMIATSLHRLGVPATLAPSAGRRVPRPSAGACFAAPAGGEVVVAGRKLVGSAQVRKGNAFLQHGSILLENGQDVVSQVTVGEPPVVHATSLSAVLAGRVSFDDAARAMAAEAGRRWPGEWKQAECSPPLPGTHNFEEPSCTSRR